MFRATIKIWVEHIADKINSCISSFFWLVGSLIYCKLLDVTDTTYELCPFPWALSLRQKYALSRSSFLHAHRSCIFLSPSLPLPAVYMVSYICITPGYLILMHDLYFTLAMQISCHLLLKRLLTMPQTNTLIRLRYYIVYIKISSLSF